MSQAPKRIGVFTSGGDAPGMNAAVRSVVRTALHLDMECVGIRRGYHGLINGDITPLTFDGVSGLMKRGGTMLYSARSEEFRTEAGQGKAVATCKMLGLEGLVGIGGDGTFRGLLELSKRDISVVGIPGTIDNDISCSSYTIGFDSACGTALDSIDKLRDTMQSHERCSVVEVMGRNAGHLALYVGLACGAIAVLIPEKKVDIMADIVEPIRRARLHGRTHFMVIVAEGVGSAYDVAQQIRDITALDTRVTVLGHVQRGGSPTARDRVVATKMGDYAVRLLAEGKTNRLIAMDGDRYIDLDIVKALSMEKDIDHKALEILQAHNGA